MNDPIDPTEATFAALRLPAAPLAPRPGFATELRHRIESALHPTTPTEAPMSTESSTVEPPATEASVPLSPYLSVNGAAAAIDWYRDVLGAIETLRFLGDDGRIGHAELVIGGSKILLADEYPEVDVHGPAHYGGTPVSLYLEVVDVDHTYERAVDAGAQSERAPSDQGHGNRNAIFLDPFGHRWMVSQTIDADRTAAANQDPSGDMTAFTVTGRTPAEPGYLVMATHDLARARAFYGALFDWEIEAGNLEGGGHIANTRFPMGFMTSDVEMTDAPATVVHIRVDDIESYATRVTELGGRVLSRNDYPSGGNAECVDDQGYRFDLFRPAPGY